MDKILLTAFLSALAGFITAILSIVKLVNEKESKTTDYRQSWNDSVRKAFANLVGLINTQASQIANAKETTDFLTKLLDPNTVQDEAIRKRGLDFNEASLTEHRNAIRDTRRSIHETYALTRLHFKPDDLSFNRVEQKFDVAMGLIAEMAKAKDEAERATLKEKVHNVASEITQYARDILKAEWENVKRGEPAYQLTKKWSIAGSIIMLFILLSIGTHAAIAIWKENLTTPLPAIHTTPTTDQTSLSNRKDAQNASAPQSSASSPP
jgi:hypothetical protein